MTTFSSLAIHAGRTVSLSAALLLTLSTLAPACDSLGGGDPAGCEDPVLSNPNGLGHGQVCEQDADCEYGRCVASPAITGGAFKVCTKDCSCGANSDCGVDLSPAGVDPSQATAGECIRFPQKSSEPIISMCLPPCQSVSDCTALGDQYTDCALPESTYGIVGLYKVCVAK